MSFNPDPSEKAQDVILSRKVSNVLHSLLPFNNVVVAKYVLKNIWECFLSFN